MSFLTPQQYSRITGELQPHMEQDVRRAHIEGTFHGHVVMQHIGNWTASNYVFTSELME